MLLTLKSSVTNASEDYDAYAPEYVRDTNLESSEKL